MTASPAQRPLQRDRWLRPDQVGERLNVHQKTVYRMSAEGCFVAAKMRGSLRILESSVNEYVLREIKSYAAQHGTTWTDEDHRL